MARNKNICDDGAAGVGQGVAHANPDEPSRPTNSPKAVYQIEPSALKLLRVFGTSEWPARLSEYLASVGTLKRLYARERDAMRIPVTLQHGASVHLSPGGQNVLVKKILDDFCPIFTPGAKVLYVGDTERKWAYFDSDCLRKLGVQIDEHGKMPDVVVHFTSKNWLVLIEAVTFTSMGNDSSDHTSRAKQYTTEEGTLMRKAGAFVRCLRFFRQ